MNNARWCTHDDVRSMVYARFWCCIWVLLFYLWHDRAPWNTPVLQVLLALYKFVFLLTYLSVIMLPYCSWAINVSVRTQAQGTGLGRWFRRKRRWLHRLSDVTGGPGSVFGRFELAVCKRATQISNEVCRKLIHKNLVQYRIRVYATQLVYL